MMRQRRRRRPRLRLPNEAEPRHSLRSHQRRRPRRLPPRLSEVFYFLVMSADSMKTQRAKVLASFLKS